MKKIILLISLCIVTIFAFSGCKKNKEKENNPSDNIEIAQPPLNEEYNINDAIKNLKQEGMVLLTEDEILQKYNFKDDLKLEKTIMIDDSDTSYEEIAILMLTNENQTFEIQMTMNERVNTLKEEYKNNSEITKILNDANNIKMKVQEGVAVLIISTNADRLMNTFDSAFFEM